MRLSPCKGALIIVLLLSLAGVCLAVQPGFDCQKAKTPIEKLICGSDVLSNQDRQMNQLYESLLNQAAEKDRALIRTEQRSFLKRRDQLCNHSLSCPQEIADKIRHVTWIVNGESIGVSQKPEFLWHVTKGAYTAEAVIHLTRESTPIRTKAVVFQVQ